jgi:hypothetical protein
MKLLVSSSLISILALVAGCAVNSTDGGEDPAGGRNTSDDAKESFSPLSESESLEKIEYAADEGSDLQSTGSVSSALAAGGANDIGVITNGPCANPVEIYMDDEDSANNSSRTGWVGSISSTTRLSFCRIDGSAFQGTGWCAAGEYAVLKLGTTCPNGSVEFSRYFDNEDTSNNNSNSGNISPSTQSSSGTRLTFCAFTRYPLAKCTAGSPVIEFPDVGISYGVFADSTVYGARETGSVYTDDEDTSNNDSWDFSKLQGYQVTAVQKIMSGTTNTWLETARVR